MQNKLRVGVLYGGQSGEHEVSLLSATSVMACLDRDRFTVVPIGINKQGRWFLNQLDDVYRPDESRLIVQTDRSTGFSLTENTLPVDVIFPVLHGPMGEDGTVQGMLQLADIPYVGAGVLASAVGMDKDILKRLVHAAGINTVDYVLLKAKDTQRETVLQQAVQQLGYPLFTKPAVLGSSVGIHKANDWQTLCAAVEDGLRYDEKLLIERAIVGRELEVSVLENQEYGADPLVSVVGEIVPAAGHDFYSYESKYVDPAGADLIVPAQLTQQQVLQVQMIAKRAFNTIDCEGMARVDVFLEQKTDRILFNELNTIPGFTSISMYPKLWESTGLSYPDLLTKLINLAVARYQRRQKLVCDYEHKLQ